MCSLKREENAATEGLRGTVTASVLRAGTSRLLPDLEGATALLESFFEMTLSSWAQWAKEGSGTCNRRRHFYYWLQLGLSCVCCFFLSPPIFTVHCFTLALHACAF